VRRAPRLLGALYGDVDSRPERLRRAVGVARRRRRGKPPSAPTTAPLPHRQDMPWDPADLHLIVVVCGWRKASQGDAIKREHFAKSVRQTKKEAYLFIFIN